MHSVLHLVGISGDWPMVFIVSVRWGLCPRWCLFVTKQNDCSVLLTYIFGLTWCWGEKIATRQFICVFLCCLCLLCVHLCIILCTGGLQNSSLCPYFFHSQQWCLEWILSSEMPATTIPASRWRLFMCWAWWCWVLLFLNSVDCRYCCRYWLLYHV